MSEIESLETRIKSLESGLKKYVGISALVGLTLGSGGVFGVAQWAYKAPLEREVMRYESAMKSIDRAIKIANEAGANEEVSELRSELLALDRSYRQTLGLVQKCMDILAENKAIRNDRKTAEWLKRTSRKLEVLYTQNPQG